MYRLLTNVLYAGKVRYKQEIHDGEQAALLDADSFGRVQALLRSHGPTLGPASVPRFTALLKGLLRCRPCDCAMTPAHTTRKDCQRYRYYTCVNAQKRGWQSCPSPSIPAAEIERVVVEQIQRLSRDPLVLENLLAQVRQAPATADPRAGEELARGKTSPAAFINRAIDRHPESCRYHDS